MSQPLSSNLANGARRGDINSPEAIPGPSNLARTQGRTAPTEGGGADGASHEVWDSTDAHVVVAQTPGNTGR
jgi:hypothetical protein